MNLMSPHEKQELLRLIEKLPTTTRCLDCVNMDGKICALAGIMPPPEILESGCEAWEFNANAPPF